jgi:hypothetical protein
MTPWKISMGVIAAFLAKTEVFFLVAHADEVNASVSFKYTDM